MKLNTDIWTEGQDISSSLEGIKIPTFRTLGAGARAGKLTLNTEFDQSPLYGVVFNSKMSEYAYTKIETNGDVKNLTTNFYEVSEVGRYLAYCPYGLSLTRLKGIDLNYRKFAYDKTDFSGLDSVPVIRLPFTRFIFLVYVIAINRVELAAGSSSAVHLMTVDTAKNTENFDTIYKIAGLSVIPYYSQFLKGPRNSQIINFYFGAYMSYAKDESIGITDNMFHFSANVDNAYGGMRGIGGVANINDYSTNNVIFLNTPKEFFTIKYNSPLIYTEFNGGINDIDNILNLLSETGLYYCTKESTARNAKLGSGATDPDVRIGKLSDGKLTGETLTGADTTKTPQSTWVNPSDFTDNNNFGGISDTDPNTYTDKIDLNTPTLSNVNVFNRSFAVNSNSVRQLADFLWNADETKFQEIVKGLALMGENPMNGIIDLRLFPFNVALKNSATTAEHIVIGRTDTGVSGIKLTENVNSLIDLGECTFFTKFKNFLDYEPYTTAQLYIPYIGVVPVSTAEFMGHKISVKMIVDYTTGAGTAIVFKDDIPFIYRNGVVGVSIPMTGTDSSTYANTVIGNVVSGVSQIATTGAGGVASFENANINSQISSSSSSASALKSAVGANGQRTGATVSGAGGIIGGLGNIYSGFTTPVQYQSAGASSPSVATWQPQKCYFIIDRPILQVPDNYGRAVGYACEITGKLSDFKGFTVVSNPEINFKCTDNERQYMINILQGGVFV